MAIFCWLKYPLAFFVISENLRCFVNFASMFLRADASESGVGIDLWQGLHDGSFLQRYLSKNNCKWYNTFSTQKNCLVIVWGLAKLEPCSPKWTCNISIVWELVRNAESQTLLQTCWIRICILARAHKSLRSTKLDHTLISIKTHIYTHTLFFAK